MPPFAAARYGRPKGYNAVGCRRAGLSREALHAIRSAYSCLHKARLMSTAVDDVRRAGLADMPELLAFLAGILPAQSAAVLPSTADDGHPRTLRLSELDGRPARSGMSQTAGIGI